MLGRVEPRNRRLCLARRRLAGGWPDHKGSKHTPIYSAAVVPASVGSPFHGPWIRGSSRPFAPGGLGRESIVIFGPGLAGGRLPRSWKLFSRVLMYGGYLPSFRRPLFRVFGLAEACANSAGCSRGGAPWGYAFCRAQ
eukprot:15319878-Alexandrium_andersonii.AAC.1